MDAPMPRLDGLLQGPEKSAESTRTSSFGPAQGLYPRHLPERFAMAPTAHVRLVLAIVCALAAPAQAQQRFVPTQSELRASYAPIVHRVAPAVVNVYAAKVVRNQNPLFDDPIFRRFFGVPGNGGNQLQRSLGSGVIVDASGLVVTNVHVIEGADEVKVSLADKREFEATIVLKDKRSDLAVLKLKTARERFPTLDFANSDALQVGDVVLAIGNPFGVGQTVTHGIVSALARTQVGITDYQFFIQTDAAINPGNSGGALVDLDGRLVGINTAIFSQSGGSIGIGFAIPTSLVRSTLEAAAHGGKVVRPWLGAAGQGVTPEIAQSLGLPHPEGVLIKDVAPGSPAAQAGVRIGDVILALDGHEIDDPDALRFRLATLPVDTEVRLALWRNGTQREVVATAAAPPEQPPRQLTTLSGRHPLSGAAIANLNPAFADELGLDPTQRGVIVTGLRSGSVA